MVKKRVKKGVRKIDEFYHTPQAVYQNMIGAPPMKTKEEPKVCAQSSQYSRTSRTSSSCAQHGLRFLGSSDGKSLASRLSLNF